MFDLINNSPFESVMLPMMDRDGRAVAVVTVKATFDIKSEGLAVSQAQEPILFDDEYNGEPGASSIKLESDIALFKPSTDVALVGSAHAPRGKPVESLDVGVAVGPVFKIIRVFGDRFWNVSFGIGWSSMSKPIPFVRMPLVYERAYGGEDRTHPDQRKHTWDERNPVGTGFRVRKDRDSLHRLPLPNLEDPNRLIHAWSDRPAPQGFGFIARHWLPRRALAGTYDERWLKERIPLLPEDFDYRFFQGAHPDLVSPTYLRGDESFKIVNASPEGRLQGTLPGLAIGLSVHRRHGDAYETEKRLALLDTVVFRPDDSKVNLVWRASVPCRQKILEIEQIFAFVVSLRTAAMLKKNFYGENR